MELKCYECKNTLPITRTLQSKDEAVVCPHCHNVIPIDKIVWQDGKFHFRVIGRVPRTTISPRILMENQTVQVLDLDKIKTKARKFISETPNLRAICSEFNIRNEDIFIEVISEARDKK